MSAGQLSEARAIVLLAIASFASTSAFRVCDPMLPALASSFGVSTGAAASVVTAFTLAYGVLQILYGPLGDRYGKFRVIALATLACTIGNVGAALSGTLGTLVVWRTVAGATAAAIVPLSLAYIGDAVPYERRQKTIARLLTGTLLGMGFGQFAGGLFTDTLGWRMAFVLLAGQYLLAALLLFRELASARRVARAARGGSSAAPPSTAASPAGSSATGVSGAGAASSGSRPPPGASLRDAASLLADRWVRAMAVFAFVEGALMFGALAFVPSHLHDRFGLSLTLAGAIGAIYGLGGLVYAVSAGTLVARFGEGGLVARGGVVLALALALLAFPPAWQWAVPATLALGFGFYMVHNTLQTHATQMAPRARGTGVALFASSLFLGQSAGVSVAGVIVDRAGTGALAGTSVLLAIVGLALPLLAFGIARAIGSHRGATAATRDGTPGTRR